MKLQSQPGDPGDGENVVAAFKKFLMRITLTPAGTAIDRVITRLTGWSLVSAVFAFSIGIPYQTSLCLMTIGKRTGRLRKAVLPYRQMGDAYVLIGSFGGAKRHPAWALNMMAHPIAWVWVARRQRPVRVELLEGEERQRVFDEITLGRGPYVRYQKMALPRQLPVFRLTPFERD
ncbi:MAG: nitroreductase family deazaflavin-dependent oxidoreductase [Deltaproteobacteria bacterium]|jgi:deazaflavin-dependent oxidoreductase (nitroreductase family)|nr:nitroreductase family deazaflavin-dependent oxidoreductase [Deltaproteobacteria bacterium]MBW2501201.1 nitroreductase family deazaflavin-dependent oxidoreductase [Deltaproteobacteria bacterium]